MPDGDTVLAKRPAKPKDANADYFRLFNEIGIISQLASTAFERALPHGLTQAQFSMLNHAVRLGDGWTPARLANAFQVTRGTMTSTLQRLESKGFIRIEPDAVDGRSKRVFITDKGRAAREEGLKAAQPVFARVPEVLSAQEVAAIMPTLEKLRAWLDENR